MQISNLRTLRVTSAIQDGHVQFIEIESRHGETCRLHNPWGKVLRLQRPDGQTEVLDGGIVGFETRKGEKYLVTPKDGPTLIAAHLAPDAAAAPTSYAFELPNGASVGGALGRRRHEHHKGLLENEQRFLAYEHNKWKW